MKIPFWLHLTILCAAATTGGCSRQKAPPPPRTQPELVLEIYEAARKQQYDANLMKIQKMRTLNPSSVFLAELENTIRFNRLSAVVSAYLKMGRFDQALHALEDYEKKHGYSDETTSTRERLVQLIALNRGITDLRHAARSEELEKRLAELKKLEKSLALSPKIRNFIRKRESMLPELRRLETKLLHMELRREIRDSLQTGSRKNAEVLIAVYAQEVPGGEKEFSAALKNGFDHIQKN